MKILPLLVKFKLRNKNFGTPTLWLPFVLLWPVLLILGFFIFLFGLAAIVVIDTRSVKRFLLLVSGVYLTLCELRGMRIDVEDRENKVLITIV